MSAEQDERRERAFHFDLFVSTGWAERFDQIVAEHVDLPSEGRLLEINCGTGDRVVAVAANLDAGEVVGTDIDPERLFIARAKELVARTGRCSFVEADPAHLGFEDNSFAGVVLDATLEPPEALAALVAEAVRVAAPGAPVAIKVQASGSFDEYYSLLWEAMYEVGIADEVWSRLEPIVTSRPTVQDAVGVARSAGLRHAKHHVTKEEWRFESAPEFLESPLSRTLFLDTSLALVPDTRREAVVEALACILEREVDGQYVAVSARALVVAGTKP